MTCACCGSSDSRVSAMSNCHDRSLGIVRCRRCGFLYLNPLPTLDALERLYADYEIPLQWRKGSEFFNHTITSLVSRVTPPHGQILEIGCSYGKILSALQDKGFLVQGVEASSRACQYIRREYGFPVYEGLIETYLGTASIQLRFDTIIALNVVEHLRDPYATLSRLNGILTPEGRVLVVVPDVALALLIGWFRNRLLRADPYGMESGADVAAVAFNSPGHVSFFTRETLRLFVSRVGWKVLEHRHAPYVLSGRFPPLRKDLLKPILYYWVRLWEALGLGAMGLSYSQMLLAEKTS